jgi:hypothetical protein
MTIVALGSLAACAPQGYEGIQSIADQAAQDVACKNQNLEPQLWDGLKTFVLEQKTLPQAADLSAAFHRQVEELKSKNSRFSDEEAERLTQQFDSLVSTLLTEAPQGEGVTTPQELLLLLSAVDVGDQSTGFRAYLQKKVRGQFSQLTKSVQSYDLNCEAGSGGGAGSSDQASSTPENPSMEVNRDYEYHRTQALQNGLSLAAFGGRWAMTTAFQSCQTTQISPLNSSSPAIKGISVVGKHSDGVGSKREISSLSQLQSTHPYIKDVSSYGAGCFNVKSNPLIYDYGGKPYATTAATAELDFFRDNGSGTSVLGFDCSAYVFSAMASAGLRLKEGRTLKASDAWAWGSGTYVEPAKNGLTCLDKISVSSTSTIAPGDIVAIYGHVLMIDKVGQDPFGIASAKTASDCSKITSAGFDFVITQSSPSNGGVGLNFYRAADYLKTSGTMRTGLERYAKAACLAKVNGTPSTPNLGTLSVVRHKGTAACSAPRVKLAREACIQSCDSLSR